MGAIGISYGVGLLFYQCFDWTLLLMSYKLVIIF
jgi:hypothetical protein